MNKLLLFRYTVILFVIVETFSIFHGYVFNRVAFPMIFMSGISVIFYPKAFLDKQSFFLVLYFAIFCLFAYLGHTLADMGWATNEFLAPLSCLSIINVFLYNRDFYGLKMVTVTGLVIIVVNSLFTIPIAINDPNAVRMMVDYTVGGNIDSMQFYQKLGIASYGLVHAVPFLYPLLIYHLKTGGKKLYRLCYLVAIVVSYYMLTKASFGTALILSTFGILCAILLSENKKRILVLVIILPFFLFLFFSDGLLVSGLNTIKPMFEGTEIEPKINDIVSSIEYGGAEGQIGGRRDLYNMSWNTFFRSPLLGSLDKKQAGGHAYIPDRLAYFGLIGTIPLIMFFYFTFKKHYFLIERRKRIYYLTSLLLFVLLGFCKNISGIENFLYLFVFLPGLCLMEEIPGNQNQLK